MKTSLTVFGVMCVMLCGPCAAFMPAQNPPWPPTYDMALSSITMVANSSGFFNSSLADSFGIVSFDWSNAKAIWAADKPMDSEELLLVQAERMKAVSPNTHAGVYKNLVKALPWFGTVREKLGDPAYADWFLRFDPSVQEYHVPQCNSTDGDLNSACSVFYHDQEQTPELPTPSDPRPDGKCVGYCDCSTNETAIPCGEYLWNYANASLREWLVDEYIMGPKGLGHPDVSFLFIDDFWCSNAINGSCTDPVQGPTEINKYNQIDMGLTDADVTSLTQGWLETMTAAQDAIIKAGYFTWSLFSGQENANASPTMVSAKDCKAWMEARCTTGMYKDTPLVMGVTTSSNKSDPLPYVTQEAAAFLLVRHDYAYMGYGVWGMSWPFGTVSFGSHGNVVTRPDVLTTDYGTPTSDCAESAPGVFTRTYSSAQVKLDCNAYVGEITMTN